MRITNISADPRSRAGRGGFSLVELLAVMSIMVVVASLSGAAISSLVSAGSVDKAVSDLSGSLELAREYAMSNHTYVRAAFGQVPASATHATPSIVLMIISSADGTLDNAGGADMANAAEWPQVGRVASWSNLTVNDALATTGDDVPSSSNIVAFQKPVGTFGPVTFNAFIQFSPSGEACVSTTEPSREIGIALDQPAPRSGKNPIVLELSGMNGSIRVLRKGDGIQ